MIRELSVFVDNRLGSLMDVTVKLLEAQINIKAVSSLDTPEFGILRLIVDKPAEAKDYLTEQGFVVHIQDVFGAELEDKKGNLNQMLAVLAEGKQNVNYIYSFVIRDGKAPVMVFRTDDVEATSKILTEAGIRLVNEDEL